MAFGLNMAQLIGRLGADVTVNHLASGGRVANMSVATDESYIDRQTGERKDRTEWHRIVTFQDGLIGMLEKHAKKGRQVHVSGKLQCGGLGHVGRSRRHDLRSRVAWLTEQNQRLQHQRDELRLGQEDAGEDRRQASAIPDPRTPVLELRSRIKLKTRVGRPHRSCDTVAVSPKFTLFRSVWAQFFHIHPAIRQLELSFVSPPPRGCAWADRTWRSWAHRGR